MRQFRSPDGLGLRPSVGAVGARRRSRPALDGTDSGAVRNTGGAADKEEQIGEGAEIEVTGKILYTFRMSRYLAIGTALVFLGVIFYALFTKENTFVYRFPALKKVQETELVQAIISKLENIGEPKNNGLPETSPQQIIQGGAKKILDKAQEGVGATIEKISDTVSGVVNNLKSEALQLVKGTVDKKVETLGEKLGVDVQQTASSISESPIIFGVKAGAAAYFTIRNREAGAIDYRVDWQDGSTDSGALQGNKSAVLSHRWEKPGTYLLKFTITLGGKGNDYLISITIL